MIGPSFARLCRTGLSAAVLGLQSLAFAQDASAVSAQDAGAAPVDSSGAFADPDNQSPGRAERRSANGSQVTSHAAIEARQAPLAAGDTRTETVERAPSTPESTVATTPSDGQEVLADTAPAAGILTVEHPGVALDASPGAAPHALEPTADIEQTAAPTPQVVPSDAAAPEPADVVPRFEWVPLPIAPDLARPGELLPALPSWSRGTVPASMVTLILLLLLAGMLRRIRPRLPDTGLLPRILWQLRFLVRVATALTIVVLVARLLGPWTEGGYPWFLAAAAVATGWSLRDVLPDLAAAMVLRFENRLRPGVWVASDTFEGVIEQRALRAVWLRDPRGDRLAIPNRTLLLAPLRVQESLGAMRDVPLRLGLEHDASELRRAIVEAVVTSPYVAPRAEAAVSRDGQDPGLWRVRARLLHERYALRFEGELLERVEEAIAARQSGAEPGAAFAKRDSNRPRARAPGQEGGAP